MNSQNEDGETPLHRAVREGHVKCVELLIEKGADKVGSLSTSNPLCSPSVLFVHDSGPTARVVRVMFCSALIEKGGHESCRPVTSNLPCTLICFSFTI